MSEIRGQSDAALDAIAAAIEPYERAHADAEVVIYRQNSVSIRIRIIDPDFNGMERADRHDAIWGLFDGLSDDIQSQVTLLLLLTPEETSTSFANFEFDHPVPSGL
jgi:stress-induced morphogen